MDRIEKTVFISYRRTTVSWALNIYQDLTQHGYDAFLDLKGIASGDFERVILENVRAMAHFLVLLTPSALERCSEPGDWLRREIETALDTQRNIVPLMFEGFDFGAPAIAPHLTGKLADPKRYNALSVPGAEYFFAAMDRLRTTYLNVALDTVLHPVSNAARQATAAQQAAAVAAPPVQQEELSAEQWFERGTGAIDPAEKIRCYTEALRLKPEFAEAYNNRGNARGDKGDLDGALADYAEAIRLKPDFTNAYNNRGVTRRDQGNLDGALADYTEALRLKPDNAVTYFNRGLARRDKGDLGGALADYAEALRLKPDCAVAYNNRGVIRRDKGDLDGALADYAEAMRLKADYADAYNNRALLRRDKGDLDGAVADYAEAIRLKPDHANAYYNRARLLRSMGQTEMAI